MSLVHQEHKTGFFNVSHESNSFEMKCKGMSKIDWPNLCPVIIESGFCASGEVSYTIVRFDVE